MPASPASFVTLSDLHLGYDRSVVNAQPAQEHLAKELGRFCGGTSTNKGSTDRLILNGDCWEGCIPRDAEVRDANSPYVSPFTGVVSRSFFETLSRYLEVHELIIVPGNHDWELWSTCMRWCGVTDYCTGAHAYPIRTNGADLNGATGILNHVLGGAKVSFPKVSLAYPVCFLGNKWPYVAFHHGHFLDDLVIGQCSPAEYSLLAPLGAIRPPVVKDDLETLRALSRKTYAFIHAMWAKNSPARRELWVMLRRDDAKLRCPGIPMPGSLLVHDERFDDVARKNLEWFTRLLAADSFSPPSIGDNAYPSYLFVGHDHIGGSVNVPGMDGYNWTAINTGGWTDDGGKGITPHGHVAVWPKGASAPEVYAVRV